MDDSLTEVLLFILSIVTMLITLLWLGKKRDKAWSEIARQSGLNFTSMDTSVRGDYRGRRLSFELVRENTGGDIFGSGGQPVAQATVLVENRSHSSLSIKPRNPFQRFNNRSGNEDFDRRFTASGSPPDFVQRAMKIIVGSDSQFLALIISIGPSICLNESNLVCRSAGILEVCYQIGLFDLLCDIAELVEQIGAEGPNASS